MLNSFGRNVVWFVEKGKTSAAPNGFVMPGDKRTVYLNVMGTNFPLSCACHELIHSIRNDNPKLYKWLHDTIGGDVVDLHDYFMDYNKRMADNGLKPITEEAAYEELYGDLMGEVSAKRDFWDSLFELSPTMAKRMARAFREVFDKILEFLRFRKVPKASPFFKDITKAQAAIKFVLSSEYKRVQNEFGTTRDRLPFMKDGKITNALKLFYGNPDVVPDDLVNLVQMAGGKVKNISKTLQLHGYHKFIADRAQAMAKDAQNNPFPSPELTAARIMQYDKLHPEHKEWYRNQGYLLQAVTDKDQLEVFRWLAVLAHTSMNKDPLGNMTEFIKVRLAQRAGGKLPNTLAGERIDRVLNANNIEEMFNVRIKGKKPPFVEGETKVKAFADTFAAALQEDNGLMETMQAVIDIWMVRYFFPTGGGILTGNQRSRVQKHMRDAEKILTESTGAKWDPDQAQAVLWFWIKDQYKYHQGNKAKEGYTYDQALEIKTRNWIGVPRDETIEPKYVKAFINQNLRDATVQIHLDHYSKVEDLKYTDPEYQGTGFPGQEKKREVKGPNATYFFFRNDTPEMQFKQTHKYRAVVQGNMYDLTKDPDGLKKKYQFNDVGSMDDVALKAMEDEIIENGYSGFTEDRLKHKVAVLFEPTKVHKLQTYKFGISAGMSAKQMKLAEKYEKDELALADIRKMYELQKSSKNNAKVASIFEDELRRELDHALIDFVSYRAGEGRWKGGKEFSPEVTVSAGDTTVLKGKFAKILKKYRQEAGLLSIPFESTRYGKRPDEIPKSQAQSFVVEPDFNLNNKHLNTISRLFTENGIFFYSFVADTNQIIVHHVKKFDGYTPAKFEKVMTNAIGAVDNHFKKASFGVGRMWFKHDVLSNDWDKVEKNKKGQVTLDGRKGGYYENIIARGEHREGELALGYRPPVVSGRNKEGTPVLAGKPNKPKTVPKNTGQVTSNYQYIDEATKAAWEKQGIKAQPQLKKDGLAPTPNVPYTPPKTPPGGFYEVLPDAELPPVKQKAYKLMRLLKSYPDVLFPLYALDPDGKRVGFIPGMWQKAENHIPKIGQKYLAERPGIHAVALPMFDQGKVRAKGEKRVWVEVEMPAMDPKTQAESDNSPILNNGQRAGIRTRTPGPHEAYDFKTNPAAVGAMVWPIAGSMKSVRILNDNDVRSILEDAGKSEEEIEAALPHTTPEEADSLWPEQVKFQPTDTTTKNFKIFFGESKVVNKDGTPKRLYHLTTSREGFEAFDTEKFMGTHFGTSQQANQIAMDKRGAITPARGFRERDRIFPVYLRIEKPLVLDYDTNWENASILARDLAQNVESTDLLEISDDAITAESDFEEYIDWKHSPENQDFLDEVRSILTDKGYDGIIYRNEVEGDTWSKENLSYIVFEPEQIKSAFNMGAWSREDERIMFQPAIVQSAQRVGDTILRGIDKAEAAIDRSHPIEKAMANKIGYKKQTISEQIKEGTKSYLAKDGRERMYTQLVDRLRPLKQMGDTTYMMGRGETGTQAIMSMILEHGKIRIDESGAFTTDERNKGFLEFIERVGQDWKPFLYWMAAKRSDKLDLEGRENWLTDVDRRSIYSKTRPENDPGFQAYAEEFDQWQKHILDLGQQAGLIDADVRKQWDHMHYIPFYRIFEDEGTREQYLAAPKSSKLRTDAGIKKLIGAEKQLGNLQENIFKNWFHIIHESQRNMTRREASRFAVENKMDSVFQLVKKVKGRPLFYVEAENPDTGKMERVFVPKHEYGNILTFREEGQPVHALVHDPDLFQALTDLNSKTFNSLTMKAFRKTKQWLTFGATIGPAFRMANLLRDTMHTSLIYSSFTPFVDTWRGFFKAMKEDEDYVKFMASGYGFGSSYVTADDPQAVNKFIDKIVKREGKGAKGRILDTPRKLWAFWEKIGSASENAARVQLYSKLKKEGYTNLQAGFEGRDLLDFTLSGASNAVKVATQMIPFLNARIQGLYKLGRTAGDARFNKEIRKNLMLRGTLMMAASLALYALAPDDEWEELEDWDKWAYYHFWIGEQHFRVPKPFEMGAIFSSAPVAMAESLAGDEDGKYLWDFMKDTAIDTFRLDVPQLVKPPIELWANKSFFTGRKIIPEYLMDLPPGEQAKQNTSETARVVGRQLGISPLKLEHLAQAYWATFGAGVLDGVDMVMHNTLDFPENPTLTIKDYPLLGRFIRGKDDDYIKQLSWYYDTLSDIDGMYKAVNKYRRTGDISKAKELTVKYREDMKKRPAFLAAKKQLSNIRNQIQRLYAMKTIGRAEKRRRLNALVKRRNEIVSRLHDRLE